MGPIPISPVPCSPTYRGCTVPGDSAHGGKVDKKRLTLPLCSSWMGEKIKPLLIWKSENPRALKGVDKKKLPVTYRSQKKAWTNTPLFNEWLKSFNSKMETQGRKVLLLMDNETVHAGFDKDKLKAINVVFFPPNSTSVTQPMDQGIIQSFKLNYRNQLHIHIMHNLKNNMDSNPMKDIPLLKPLFGFSEPGGLQSNLELSPDVSRDVDSKRECMDQLTILNRWYRWILMK